MKILEGKKVVPHFSEEIIPKCKAVMTLQPFAGNSASKMVSLNPIIPIRILQKTKLSNGLNIMPRQFSMLQEHQNITANEALGYRTPYEKRHGSTPDISAYIIFHFWEAILYLEANNSFPDSKELPGRFLGVAKNVGDALTFVILSQEGTRIQCSVIRSATGKPPAGFPNMRITHDSLTETTNPETLALLQLTSTPSTNVSIQVDERNGGLMTDPWNPRKFGLACS